MHNSLSITTLDLYKKIYKLDKIEVIDDMLTHSDIITVNLQSQSWSILGGIQFKKTTKAFYPVHLRFFKDEMTFNLVLSPKIKKYTTKSRFWFSGDIKEHAEIDEAAMSKDFLKIMDDFFEKQNAIIVQKFQVNDVVVSRDDYNKNVINVDFRKLKKYEL